MMESWDEVVRDRVYDILKNVRTRDGQSLETLQITTIRYDGGQTKWLVQAVVRYPRSQSVSDLRIAHRRQYNFSHMSIKAALDALELCLTEQAHREDLIGAHLP